MTKRDWTTGEFEVLRLFADHGVEGCAILLDRSETAIERKARELGIDMTPTAMQPKPTEAAMKVLERVRGSRYSSLCPACAQRYILVRSSGLCRLCHVDRLIEDGKTALGLQVRNRQRAEIRQMRRRVRLCAKCGGEFYPRPESTATTCRDCRRRD